MITEFYTPTKIIIGEGAVNQIGDLVQSFGRRVLVVSGKSGRFNSHIEQQFLAKGIEPTFYQTQGEPTIETINHGLDIAKKNSVDVIVGIGGGSSLDTGKAIAILMTNPGEIFDYLEIIGKGKPFQNPALPYVAIPTTAGTGTEVTKNAVIGVPDSKIKVSLRSALMMPKIAIVDPELTYKLTREVTAYSGMDALTQLIEPYVCNQPNPLTDALCRDGILRIAENLLKAYNEGSDKIARQNLAIASMFSGLALANAKLGAVHGFAGVLGGMYGAPHGMICAILLPYVIEVNLEALQSREPNNPALSRYGEISKLIFGSGDEKALIGWTINLCRQLSIPNLRAIGVKEEDFEIVIEKASQASSMKGNPIKLREEELLKILERAF